MPFPSVNSGGFHSFIAALGRSAGEKWDALFRGSLLRVTFFSGLILALLIGGGTATVYLLGGGRLRVRGGERDGGFYRLLRDYDRAAGHGGSESLDRELAKLEQRAGGVESWLSVLKRRRRLARLDHRYMPAYRQAARRARQAFPYSEPLAALASAALLQDAAISREAEAELRDCLPLFTDSRLQTLRLSLHVLLGDLKNPGAASALPRDISLLELGGSFSAAEREIIAGDLAILKLLDGNAPAAAAEIQAVLSAYSPRGGRERQDAASSPPDDFFRFAAEYHYDFGDLLRSAELFSWLPGEAALLRQADALWLAGYADNARTIWSILAASAPGSTARALYNLAMSAENRAAATALLERLAARGGDSAPLSPDGTGRRYGLIRYSRLFDAPRALAILGTLGGPGSGTEPGAAVNALVELEILRRRTETAGTGRLAAETWLLLGRYPEDENLFRWAAWLFDLQRNYAESDVLLKTAARRGFAGQWLALHEALRLLREGNYDAAETILASIPAESASWTIAANRGRILEARRDPARALECYETAAALLEKKRSNAETASRIQFRVAQCLTSLGRPGESRRVLEYALDLNPDNLSARLELGRLGLSPGRAE
jgi:predicted negative regulator of RcsB-dependent stress response